MPVLSEVEGLLVNLVVPKEAMMTLYPNSAVRLVPMDAERDLLLLVKNGLEKVRAPTDGSGKLVVAYLPLAAAQAHEIIEETQRS